MRKGGCIGIASAAYAICTLASAVPAMAQNVGEDRLRAQLRAATVQLRSLQDQNASLQAMQAQAEREKMALAEKAAEREKMVAALQQQLRSSRAMGDAAAERLKAQQENFTRVDAQNRDNFGKLQTAYNLTIEGLRLREAETMRLDQTLSQTRGRVQVCEIKNAELYKLGVEVLDLFDNRGMLATLGSVEPFTKLKRVEYENQKQDYEDKLRANAVIHPIR
jgi:septal ring factor EnvC (AmiA/AmiB activator)